MSEVDKLSTSLFKIKKCTDLSRTSVHSSTFAGCGSFSL